MDEDKISLVKGVEKRMAIRTREEILNSIKERFSDDTSDETLSLIEDVTDTLTDYETRTKDSTDWKTKYEENDKEWRTKYKERFFNSDRDVDNIPPDSNIIDKEDDTIDEPKTFDDLFKKKEDK